MHLDWCPHHETMAETDGKGLSLRENDLKPQERLGTGEIRGKGPVSCLILSSWLSKKITSWYILSSIIEYDHEMALKILTTLYEQRASWLRSWPLGTSVDLGSRPLRPVPAAGLLLQSRCGALHCASDHPQKEWENHGKPWKTWPSDQSDQPKTHVTETETCSYIVFKDWHVKWVKCGKVNQVKSRCDIRAQHICAAAYGRISSSYILSCFASTYLGFLLGQSVSAQPAGCNTRSIYIRSTCCFCMSV